MRSWSPSAPRSAWGAVRRLPLTLTELADDCFSELFEAAVDATAEAAIDSLCMATTVEGQGGNVAHALPLDRLVAVMNDHGRPAHLPGGGS